MKRWFKYIKPYWPFFVLGPICMIIEVIGEVLMPKLLASIINKAPIAIGSFGRIAGGWIVRHHRT